MRVLAHPLRLDGSGSFATVEQSSVANAQQLAVCVASTVLGERELAPDFGVFDPVAVGVSRAEVTAAMALCAPDVTVVDVQTKVADGRQAVQVSVRWADGV